jgi:hypothetical protein
MQPPRHPPHRCRTLCHRCRPLRRCASTSGGSVTRASDCRHSAITTAVGVRQRTSSRRSLRLYFAITTSAVRSPAHTRPHTLPLHTPVAGVSLSRPALAVSPCSPTHRCSSSPLCSTPTLRPLNQALVLVRAPALAHSPPLPLALLRPRVRRRVRERFGGKRTACHTAGRCPRGCALGRICDGARGVLTVVCLRSVRPVTRSCTSWTRITLSCCVVSPCRTAREEVGPSPTWRSGLCPATASSCCCSPTTTRYIACGSHTASWDVPPPLCATHPGALASPPHRHAPPPLCCSANCPSPRSLSRSTPLCW